MSFDDIITRVQRVESKIDRVYWLISCVVYPSPLNVLEALHQSMKQSGAKFNKVIANINDNINKQVHATLGKENGEDEKIKKRINEIKEEETESGEE